MFWKPENRTTLPNSVRCVGALKFQNNFILNACLGGQAVLQFHLRTILETRKTIVSYLF